MDNETKDAIHNLELAVKELKKEQEKLREDMRHHCNDHNRAETYIEKRLEELEKDMQLLKFNSDLRLPPVVSKPRNSSYNEVSALQSLVAELYIELANVEKVGKLAGLKLADAHWNGKAHDCGGGDTSTCMKFHISKLEGELK